MNIPDMRSCAGLVEVKLEIVTVHSDVSYMKLGMLYLIVMNILT